MQSNPRQGGEMQTSHNIAARAAEWSRNHRKLAIWGFFLGTVALFFVLVGSGSVERQQIETVDSFSGESHQAERALTDAGMRPNEEIALIQSESLDSSDPAFQAVVDETAAKLRQTEYVTDVATPVQG